MTFGRLFLLFTIVPLLELFLLLRIGAAIGAWPTVAIVIVTGLLGAALARHEGMRAWRAVNAELAAGRVPAAELLHGFLILVAGVLLVTPGVVTDALGFALLTRPIRSRFLRWLRRRFVGRIEVGGVEVGSITDGPFPWSRAARGSAPGSGTDQEPARSADPQRGRPGEAGRIIDL